MKVFIGSYFDWDEGAVHIGCVAFSREAVVEAFKRHIEVDFQRTFCPDYFIDAEEFGISYSADDITVHWFMSHEEVK